MLGSELLLWRLQSILGFRGAGRSIQAQASADGNTVSRATAGGRRNHTVPGGLPILESLRKRSREESTTPRSMVLAGWASAVGHQLGRQTVAFGIVAAGRHGIPEGVVGSCLNFHPCTVQTNAGLRIEEISRTVQKEMAEAVAYEGCPLDAIQRVVTGGQPLFNSVVNYRKFDNVAQTARRSVEFKTESIRDLWAYAYFLGVEEVEDRLQVDFQWYEGRVDEACALRLLDLFIDSLGKLARQS
ncbi:CoA-dependent acyltransferase [Aspergillus japonicus CBS 114.51]|uniref:CoA-dependent acyltransferase n=1 Tax=Aspergillus japonicus CBS 114.51 TaxID=1448312 RepID=A0A8T8X8Y2_ASPJA|nr:CoA-dependent acyltransferase [Aspergillus japonicus CBS 114.51]RAH84627.1 CoA-dependent acyltransferase [Aspergillus japonicus CBS 114.51]